MPTKRILLLAALLPAAGCAGMLSHVAVPTELTAAPELEVKGLQGWRAGHRLTFGEFRVDGVKRGETWAEAGVRTVQDAVLERLGSRTESRADERQLPSSAEQRLRFQLRESGGEPWRADCDQTASLRRTDLPIVGEIMHGQQSALFCRLDAPGDTGSVWRMELLSRRGKLGGQLSSGEVRYRIEQTDRLDNTRWRTGQANGFLFLEGTRPVALADVLNGGRIRLDPTLDPEVRAALATAASALLLRGNLLDEIEDV